MDAMRSSSVSVTEMMSPVAILAAMERAGVDELPVVAADGALRGMVERRAVERRLYDRGDQDATAAMIAEEPVARVSGDEPIENGADALLAANLGVVPVVSPHGRLDGLLVLDDLRRVPGLLEGVGELRRRREVDAGAGVSRTALACGLVSAALGMALFALWVMGPAYGLPSWVAWADGLAALLAFVAAVSARSREMISVPLWSIAGIGLCFAAAVGHVWKDGPWATWLQLACGIAFLLMAAGLGAALPRRHRRGIGFAAQPR
jgi:CBS domain-containing protein